MSLPSTASRQRAMYSGIIARSMRRTSAQRNGSSGVPRTPLAARSALNIGVDRGPNFIFDFLPSARSVGGCKRHVTFVLRPADRLVGSA